MALLLLAYLASILTILSPCILPVLPFVFARADQLFLRTGLPLLLGMAIAFTGVATLAAVGGGWAVETNQYGRLAALALLALFAMTLLSERLAHYLLWPVPALGRRLSSTLRRSDPRPHPDRRRAHWRERLDLTSAPGLRPRRGDIACPGAFGWRPNAGISQANFSRR
jgi:cytochrome c biogenesis protein CcdA